jgi:hypothetical protein
MPESGWTPLLTVNHPEYPSAHSFWSSALLTTVAAFFGTNDVSWTLTTSKQAVPQLVKEQRTYGDVDAIMREIGNARVWAGLHWRQSINDGILLGLEVARHVTQNFFQPE